MNKDSKLLVWIFRRLLVIVTGITMVLYTDELQSISSWTLPWLLFVLGIVLGRMAFIGFGSKE